MQKSYDVIILGGGVNGCAIARKLSGEGKRVLLLERNNIGGGTSSNSSKLVHGGLRYLETLQFKLVRESLQDRGRLCELYPDLVQMAPFYMPVYDDSLRPSWMLNLGLILYDFLAWSGNKDHCHRRIANEEFLRLFPGVRKEGLRRVYMYYDGKTNDLELTRRLAGDARDKGGIIKENCCSASIHMDSREFRVICRDDKGEQSYSAANLINVTGPWIEEVNDKYKLPHMFGITRVSGIHIVIDRLLVPDCMFLQTASRRIFFMIPWQGRQTIIGTTERIENCACDEIGISEPDISYLLDCANCYLQEPLRREDVYKTFLGIRPLIKGKDDTDATSMSRDYKIEVIDRGQARLINVYGGKLTTCLSMAEKVAARLP